MLNMPLNYHPTTITAPYDPNYKLSLLHFLIIHFSHSPNLIKTALFDGLVRIDLSLVDSFGRNILHDALRVGTKELIELLIVLCPSNLCVQDANGRYPLDDLKQRQRKYHDILKEKQASGLSSSFRSTSRSTSLTSIPGLNQTMSSSSTSSLGGGGDRSNVPPTPSDSVTSSPLG